MIGSEQQERTVALIGLGNEVLTGTARGTEPRRYQGATDEVTGSGTASLQRGCEHRRGRGLSMCADDRDASPAEHDRRERGAAVHDAQPATPSRRKLGVVLPDRRRDHHGGDAAKMARIVTHLDGRAERGKLIELDGVPGVAPGDRDTHAEHDAGDPGHAGAADAAEMDRAESDDPNGVGRYYQAHEVASQVAASRVTASQVTASQVAARQVPARSG